MTMLRFKWLAKRIGEPTMRANLFWLNDEEWAKINLLFQ